MKISLNARNRLANSFPPGHVLQGKKNAKILDESILFSDDIIANAINSGKPRLIGRFGGTEARVLGCYLDIYKGQTLWDPISTLYSAVSFKKRLRQLMSESGVYPINKRVVRTFINEQLIASREIDVLGTWGSTFTWVEKYALRNPGIKSVSHHSVAPWIENFPPDSLSLAPWAFSLSGKKILIVSGFSKSFQEQFNRIEKVFPINAYPKFSAQFINCPISTGGMTDGKTWVDHLERIKSEMECLDFDVALVSAGAYALPLAYHAKKMGKVGITCGGELQLFFGVVGRRWEQFEKVTKYRNEYWVRPSETEKPSNWKNLEDGCYW